jgi:hypothetical protein
MCTRVVVDDIDPLMPRWDRPNVSIVVARELAPLEALLQVRALLIYLGACQTGLGATCWCGDSVELPQLRETVPSQRSPVGRQEIRRGA